MSQNIAITQLAQVGLAEKTVQEVQAHPEVQRQAAQQQAPEILLRQNETVRDAAESDAARRTGIQERREQRRRARDEQRRRRRAAGRPDDADRSDEAPLANLWAGNIINRHV